MKKMKKDFLAILGVTIIFCFYANVVWAEGTGGHMIILIDASGSMNRDRLEVSDGGATTRFDAAKELSLERIDWAKTTHSVSKVAIATFVGSWMSYVDSDAPVFYNIDDAKDKVKALEHPETITVEGAEERTFIDIVSSLLSGQSNNGNIDEEEYQRIRKSYDPTQHTPLAGSICDAVDELVLNSPRGSNRVIQLSSDGGENSTPITHQCFGPSSSTPVDPYDSGSWHNNVFEKVANNPSITAYIDVFDSSYISGASSGISSPSSIGPNFHDFMADLAERSGGEFRIIFDEEPLPIRGDINKDYILDIFDIVELDLHVGFPAIAAEPGCDLNADLFVDEQDRSILESIVLDNLAPNITENPNL